MHSPGFQEASFRWQGHLLHLHPNRTLLRRSRPLPSSQSCSWVPSKPWQSSTPLWIKEKRESNRHLQFHKVPAVPSRSRPQVSQHPRPSQWQTNSRHRPRSLRKLRQKNHKPQLSVLKTQVAVQLWRRKSACHYRSN